jgi:phospholipid/cholesterol/gamma-HCH transport system ATP-binding protein
MIKVSRLTKSFSGEKVLDQIDLEAARGEIVVVMGPSGTGKSVFLLHLIGLMSPDSGYVEINGVRITDLDEAALLQARRQIGYLFQDAALYDFMTVAENLAFPLREHTRLKPAEITSRVEGFLKMVDMAGAGDKVPAELSGGMRKRVALARAMISGTRVLLCDEPTSGLDPVRSRDISVLIRDLSRSLGCTTLITSHDVANSFRIADRLVVLNRGRIAASGTQDDLKRSPDPFVRDFLDG